MPRRLARAWRSEARMPVKGALHPSPTTPAQFDTYMSTSRPSLACMSRRSGAKPGEAAGEGWPEARERGTSSSPTTPAQFDTRMSPHPSLPRVHVTAKRSEAGREPRGRDGRMPVRGALHPCPLRRPRSTPTCLRLVPPSRAPAAGEGPRSGGEGHLALAHYACPVRHLHVNVSSLPRVRSRGGGMAGGQGGGHSCLAHPNPWPNPHLASHTSLSRVRSRGGGMAGGQGGGHFDLAHPALPVHRAPTSSLVTRHSPLATRHRSTPRPCSCTRRSRPRGRSRR
jgi:hypothetical protein